MSDFYFNELYAAFKRQRKEEPVKRHRSANKIRRLEAERIKQPQPVFLGNEYTVSVLRLGFGRYNSYVEPPTTGPQGIHELTITLELTNKESGKVHEQQIHADAVALNFEGASVEKIQEDLSLLKDKIQTGIQTNEYGLLWETSDQEEDPYLVLA
jgi:hypothetical protein